MQHGQFVCQRLSSLARLDRLLHSSIYSPTHILMDVHDMFAFFTSRQDGSTEYKRRIHSPTTSRLRSLVTQMSYRLDEGMGRCTYQVGVEDDGCHSLLDYASVSESARILECIARSLNAVVVERLMIQGDVVIGEDGKPTRSTCEEDLLVVQEPSVFGNGHIQEISATLEDAKEEKRDSDESIIIRGKHKLNTKGGGSHLFTRCELSVQRVETHLLDPTPLALSAIRRGEVGISSNGPTTNTLSSPGSKGAAGEAAQTSLRQRQVTGGETRQLLSNTNTTSVPEEDVPKPCVITETLSSRNIRVVVVGNVDAGKSTLIGAMTTSTLDDGRGRCRTSIMKHRHEIETGRTSTATTHLMGFRSDGEPISGKDSIRVNKRKTEDEVARESYRICTLVDLAGHEKYLKTTIHGVSSGMADYSLILVNSRHPPTHMTQHHLNLCCSFSIPVIVVFTKVDNCPEHAKKNSKEEVIKLLRAPDVDKKPFVVRNEQDVATCVDKLHSLAPMIDTSCVTGEGMNLLRKLLFSLPKRRRHEKKTEWPFEFLVDDIFNVPGVGAVVSGFVNAGNLTVGSNCNVFVGPCDDGTFIRTVAKSAHIARINTLHISSGQSACLSFSLSKDQRKKLRRGMVVKKENPTSTRQFDAEICVLKGEGTTIRRSYQAYVHILNVRQSAFARSIEIVNTNAIGLPPSHRAFADEEDQDGIVLRPGSRAKVRFEFAQRPEFVRPGMRMLFRDGRVRGVGIVTGVPNLEAVTAH